MGQDNPGKLFYRIGEVSQQVGVESYVLRYWEKMFPQLNPEKDESDQRVYTKSDIDLLLRIKDLLYKERYTIDGAKRKLRQEYKSKVPKNSQKLPAILRDIKNILQEISDVQIKP